MNLIGNGEVYGLEMGGNVALNWKGKILWTGHGWKCNGV